MEPIPLALGWEGMQDRPIQETPTEARQAVKVRPMKYVLGIGTLGAVVGLLLAWLFSR